MLRHDLPFASILNTVALLSMGLAKATPDLVGPEVLDSLNKYVRRDRGWTEICQHKPNGGCQMTGITNNKADDVRYTTSRIPLKKFYGPDNIRKIDYEKERGDPGSYPFARGIFPTGYRKFAWQNSMISGYGLPDEANQRQKYLRDKGASGYGGQDSINFAFDNPC